MQQSEMAIKEHASELATPELLSKHIDITIVVPLMNEQESVRILFERIQAQINQIGKSYEIIFVDDGSTDKTFEVLKALHEENPGIVHVVRFRRNFGKTPGSLLVLSALVVMWSLLWMVICRMTHRRFHAI
ncbi:glycosyltransferase [Dictyobacter kobayashii]|uniref:Glycosyltransferase 2-like domain-containing protein n=1 Tax=Dictyobacter kobayashii TaxID=2014872 RepID=A0A402ADV9_9CHLR|nr:glycosyltransferase [Dictyobacter kobayashii]GCE17276.1 hypothetical protein KDK_10760 [Dictyobacter kobayashii]